MGDILRREIKCGDLPPGPDEFAQERDVATRAAARIEHRRARRDAHEAEGLLILSPGRLEVRIQPRCVAHRVTRRCHPRIVHGIAPPAQDNAVV